MFYYREIIYNEPYCNNPKKKKSEIFKIYNKQSLNLEYSLAVDNDICNGDTYQLTLQNPYLFACYSLIPSALLPANLDNHLVFQLYNPANGQALGDPITYDFNGQITTGAMTNTPFVFTFNNTDPQGNPYFVPTSTQYSFPIGVQISGTYLGCTINPLYNRETVQYINFSPSAFGGKIMYDCNVGGDVVSVNNGITYAGYEWQYSYDDINYLPLSAPAISVLAQNNIPTPNGQPIFIRRKAFGTGNCPNPAYSNVIVIAPQSSAPTFTLIASKCQGSVPVVLPSVSENGVHGTWIPAQTQTNHSANYIFRPYSGYCLPDYVYHLEITDQIIATFDPIPAMCSGVNFVLPTTSTNGITGSWSPAFNPNATTVYTFQPDTNIDQCSYTPIVIQITINNTTTAPQFAIPTALCGGMSVPVLPTTSLEGIMGQWSPATINPNFSGTYTFTPLPNQCAYSTQIQITIIPDCNIYVDWGSDVSCQLAIDPQDDPDVKDYETTIADGPCLRVCENSTIEYTFSGAGIGAIDHTVWQVTGGSFTATNTSCTVTWDASSVSILHATVYLTNGVVLELQRCVEKLPAPIALFDIFPAQDTSTHFVCLNSAVLFENLSSTNAGNDVFYYHWDFGDGFSSNEFEPTHTYQAAGHYIVQLVVTNGCSCVNRYTMEVEVVENKVVVECPSIICEGDRATYSIDNQFGEDCPNLQWSVTGGHIINHNQNNTEIEVVWDAVDESGFGYVGVIHPSCLKCSNPIKIPVIKKIGTIQGTHRMCPKSQNTFALPQWASTDFQWSIDDGGTGATIILNHNRNEVIVQSQSHGTLRLFCTYFNTLLGCGGTAEYLIEVKPTASLASTIEVCDNTPLQYQIIDESQNNIATVNWQFTGPNGFYLSGSNGLVDITFPSPGTYVFGVTDNDYCTNNTFIVVKPSPAAPTIIAPPTTICPGIPVTFTCNSQEGMVPYWSVTNGTIIGSTSGNQVVINFDTNNAVTNYTVQVIFQGPNCNSTTTSLTIPRTVPTITPPTNPETVCGSSFMDLNAGYTEGENYIWTIQPETAGSVNSGQNTSHINILWNQHNGPATVKLLVRKCGKIYTYLWPFNVVNHPDITLTTSNTAICAGQAVIFNFQMAFGSGYFDVEWDFGDGTTQSSGSNAGSSGTISHIYSNPPSGGVTNYTVTVKVIEANGCIMDAFGSIPVVVSPSPVVDLNIPDMFNICGYEESGNSNFDLSVNIQSGFGQTTVIQWYHNGIAIPANLGGNQSIINVSTNLNTGYFGAGSYYATVTNNFNCTHYTETISIINDCTINPINGGPGIPCNCDLDLVKNYPCQGIQIDIENPTCSILDTRWIFYNMPIGTIVTNSTNTSYEANAIIPGKYAIDVETDYSNGTTNDIICTTRRRVNFIVPYQAGLKYQVSCNNQGGYTVNLIDFSVYYPYTPIEKYEFTTNGGATWHDLGTVTTYTATLVPGTYNLGVRISRNGYTMCTAFEQLELPNYPSANFTFENNVCQNKAMSFFASDQQPDLSYEWSFNGTAVNLQRDPVRIFETSGLNGVQLTVKNKYGCTATWSTLVNVLRVNMKGSLKRLPEITCQGGAITINYDPDQGTTSPEVLYWYKDEYTPQPYATTYAANPNLTVTESGQYFVYLENADTCKYFQVEPTSVVFVPKPPTPVIQGNPLACEGAPINLSIPSGGNVTYQWAVNGIVRSDWNNATTISDNQLHGTYVYTVLPMVPNPSGGFCYGDTAQFTVNVVEAPEQPLLEYELLSCIPYLVKVKVTNPQTGIQYYWSNGLTGTETYLNHDGPIQVRAEAFNCIAKAQIELPRDLTKIQWTFPQGCYTYCNKLNPGAILGPIGFFNNWIWIDNGNVVASGNESVELLSPALPDHTYELVLETENCHTTLSGLSIDTSECVACSVEYHVTEIDCIHVNGVAYYTIHLDVQSAYTEMLTAYFTVPNGQGVLTPMPLSIPPGNSHQTIYFTAINGFNGGSVDFNIEGHVKEAVCNQLVKWDLPTDCPEVDPCKFVYDIKKIVCTTLPSGRVYYVEMAVTNPYTFQATMALSFPNGIGVFQPSSQFIQPGTANYTMVFTTPSSFTGGILGGQIDISIGSMHCVKDITFNCPSQCNPPEDCNLVYEYQMSGCAAALGGGLNYNGMITIANPNAEPMHITFVVPAGQGVVNPIHIVVPPGSSQHQIQFIPLNGFSGGIVNVGMIAQWGQKLCYTHRRLYFEKCCIDCSDEEFPLPRIGAQPILEIAPNPAREQTVIFYTFVAPKMEYALELTDMLGRTLMQWKPNMPVGTQEVNTGVLAHGHYLIIMKESGKIIETKKLIIR